MAVDRIKELVQEGLRRKLSGDLQGAAEVWTEALLRDPTNERAREGLESLAALGLQAPSDPLKPGVTAAMGLLFTPPAIAMPGGPRKNPFARQDGPERSADEMPLTPSPFEAGRAPRPAPLPGEPSASLAPDAGAASSTLVFGLRPPEEEPPPASPEAPWDAFGARPDEDPLFPGPSPAGERAPEPPTLIYGISDTVREMLRDPDAATLAEQLSGPLDAGADMPPWQAVPSPFRRDTEPRVPAPGAPPLAFGAPGTLAQFPSPGEALGPSTLAQFPSPSDGLEPTTLHDLRAAEVAVEEETGGPRTQTEATLLRPGAAGGRPAGAPQRAPASTLRQFPAPTASGSPSLPLPSPAATLRQFPTPTQSSLTGPLPLPSPAATLRQFPTPTQPGLASPLPLPSPVATLRQFPTPTQPGLTSGLPLPSPAATLTGVPAPPLAGAPASGLPLPPPGETSAQFPSPALSAPPFGGVPGAGAARAAPPGATMPQYPAPGAAAADATLASLAPPIADPGGAEHVFDVGDTADQFPAPDFSLLPPTPSLFDLSPPPLADEEAAPPENASPFPQTPRPFPVQQPSPPGGTLAQYASRGPELRAPPSPFPRTPRPFTLERPAPPGQTRDQFHASEGPAPAATPGEWSAPAPAPLAATLPPPPAPARPVEIEIDVAVAPESGSDDIGALLMRAADQLDLDDHTGALQTVEKVLALDPQNATAHELMERCESTLLTMFESKIGDMEHKPKVRLKPDEIVWLNLDHRAGFVLSMIDGTISYDDLFALSSMSRLDTARIIVHLLQARAIG